MIYIKHYYAINIMLNLVGHNSCIYIILNFLLLLPFLRSILVGCVSQVKGNARDILYIILVLFITGV